jgi:hypothetical protein
MSCTLDLALRVKPEHAAIAARLWPSVETPTVRTDRPRRGRLAAEWNGPSPRSAIGISAGQGYRTSSPVTVLPISMRWISDVPSKMVKIVDCGAVFAAQRPA